MRLVIAVISTLFMGGTVFIFIALLEHLTGVSLFDCFNRECWKEKPIATAIKAIVILFAVALLVASFIAALNGFSPFGDTADSERWDPAW